MGARHTNMVGRAQARVLLGLLYGLTTLFSSTLHTHHSADHHSPRALAACADVGLHWAPHTDAPDLSHPEARCVACQDRSEHLAPPSFHFALVSVADLGSSRRNTNAPRAVQRTASSRAPPENLMLTV